MKRAILCLGLLVVIVLNVAPLASAESSGNEDKSGNCKLLDPMIIKSFSSYDFVVLDPTKTHSLPLSEQLSFVQHSYLVELCEMLHERGTYLSDEARRISNHAIRLEDKDPVASAITSKELLALEKNLLEVRLQNLNKLTEILEQSITASVFNEEEFWKVWRQENQRRATIERPLVIEFAHMALELDITGRMENLIKKDAGEPK